MHGDGDPVSFGCAVAFINYLTVQLGFTINQVISTYANNLATCYHTADRRQFRPLPSVLGAASQRLSGGNAGQRPGPKPQQPVSDRRSAVLRPKETFGKDETKDIIDTQGGLVSSAFWVTIDGFSQQSFQSLGVQVGNFTGSFATLPGVSISLNPAGAQFENGVNGTTPQRIRIPFDID